MTSLAILRDRFAALCAIRTPVAARISGPPDNLRIFSEWTSRSPVLKKNLKTAQVAYVDGEAKRVRETFDLPSVIQENQALTYSKDGKLSAVFGFVMEEKEKKFYVRIVDNGTNIDKHTYNLTAKKAHGVIYLNGDFGGAAFSANNELLVYAAERDSKPVEFFDADLEKKDDNGKDKQAIGEKFVWKETFGEQTGDVADPVIVVLTIATGEVKVLDSVPRNLFPTQKFFSSDNKTIIFSAIDAKHYKLGKVFCSNRNFVISEIDVATNTYTPLLNDIRGIDHIRLSPDGVDLFIVCRENKTDSHQGTYVIATYNTLTKSLVTHNRGDVFLPAPATRSFTADGKFLFTSIADACFKIQLFDVEKDELVTLSPPNVSEVLLDVADNFVVLQRSAGDVPPTLVLGKLVDDKLEYLQVSQPTNFPVNYTVEDIGGSAEGTFAHSFVMLPKKSAGEKVPLIALIHGGPHSSSLKAWPRRFVGLLLEGGYAVVQINYPGSIGFSEDYVQQLPSNIGDLDVKFCEDAITETLEKYSQLDGEKVSIVGGSHGGFLVTHLAGKNPNRYKCVVSLNPVINIRTMFDITDIPDWCAFEASRLANIDTALDSTIEAAMLSKSPISRAHNIAAPYLLCIGGKDLRVPPHFRHLIRILRKNGVKNKVLVYPESNHALDEVDVEIDVVLNSIRWIEEHNA